MYHRSSLFEEIQQASLAHVPYLLNSPVEYAEHPALTVYQDYVIPEEVSAEDRAALEAVFAAHDYEAGVQAALNSQSARAAKLQNLRDTYQSVMQQYETVLSADPDNLGAVQIRALALLNAEVNYRLLPSLMKLFLGEDVV